jgi:hypothetical protein
MTVCCTNWLIRISIILMCSCLQLSTKAQSILGKNISINAQQQKLGKVLTAIEEQGHFKFSYNSTILPLDSLVDIRVDQLSLAETLDQLFKQRYVYKEAYNFIIIRYAPFQLSLIVQESVGNQDQYVITGKVVDEQSGKPLANASVYEKNLLASTLTDADGHFSLKLKKISQTLAITISKVNYKDLTSFFLPEIAVYKNEKNKYSSDYIADADAAVEKTFLGRLLITPKQNVQSANLAGFIARAPAQVSLAPGLSSHGALSGQVINKFSFNITGDYNAGADGIEIGLFYNIDKKDVRFLQVSGVFNLVGGQLSGIQISGFHNDVLKNATGLQVSVGYNQVREQFKGLQIGGLINVVRQNVRGLQLGTGYNLIQSSLNGVQLGGLYNRVKANLNGLQVAVGYNETHEKLKGLQIAGLFNNVNKDLDGLQIAVGYNRTKNQLKSAQIGAFNSVGQLRGLQLAVLGNIAHRSVNGLQLGGLFNYTRKLKGVQIGLFNVADTSSGYSIGLINWVKNGYHQISLSTNESFPFNVALKTGSRQLYTALLYSANLSPNHQLTAIGIGFGRDFKLGPSLSLQPEINSRYVYQGDWSYKNILNRVELNVAYRFNRWLAIHAGPAFNMYYSAQKQPLMDYDFIGHQSSSFTMGQKTRGWLGWNLGLSLF